MQLLKLTDAIEIPYEADNAQYKWEWAGHKLRIWQWPAISAPIAEVLDRKTEDKSYCCGTQLYLDEELIWWTHGDPDIPKIWHQITGLLLTHAIVCEPSNMVTTQYPVDDMLLPK